MKRIILTMALLAASPVAAQDMGGALNLGEVARGQVIAGTARGYAERGYAARGYPSAARRPGPARSARAAQICADYPSYRARFGGDHPNVQRLAVLCRMGGYATAAR